LPLETFTFIVKADVFFLLHHTVAVREKGFLCISELGKVPLHWETVYCSDKGWGLVFVSTALTSWLNHSIMWADNHSILAQPIFLPSFLLCSLPPSLSPFFLFLFFLLYLSSSSLSLSLSLLEIKCRASQLHPSPSQLSCFHSEYPNVVIENIVGR
jgi:hypothetical protein